MNMELIVEHRNYFEPGKVSGFFGSFACLKDVS